MVFKTLKEKTEKKGFLAGQRFLFKLSFNWLNWLSGIIWLALRKSLKSVTKNSR